MFNPRIGRADPSTFAQLNRESSREQSYLDVLIDGRSAQDLLCGAEPFELLVALRWDPPAGFRPPECDEAFLDQLLGRRPPTLESGRTILLACSECGWDPGCGAVTGLITEMDDAIVCSDFGYEMEFSTDPDEPTVDRRGYERIGPFRFDRQQYREALLNPPQKPE